MDDTHRVYRAGNGDRGDPTLEALQLLSSQLKQIEAQVEAKVAKPGNGNGRLRDFVLGLLSVALVSLAAWLWTSHADLEVMKLDQKLLRESVERFHRPGG